MSARSGEFDETNPPERMVDGEARPVLAVRMKDTGIIHFDLDAVAHFDVVLRLGLDPDQVADGGWITSGKWVPGHSEKYSSKDPEEVRRINIECDLLLATTTKRKTVDALEILDDRYFNGKPEMEVLLTEAEERLRELRETQALSQEDDATGLGQSVRRKPNENNDHDGKNFSRNST